MFTTSKQLALPKCIKMNTDSYNSIHLTFTENVTQDSFFPYFDKLMIS